MSSVAVSTSSPSSAAGAPTASPTRAGPRLRRPPRPVVIIGALLLIALLLAVLLPRKEAPQPLDPASASSSGSRALAQVLARHGVTVEPVRTVEELRAARLDAETTLVVANAAELSEQGLAAVRERSDVRDLVLIKPSNPVLEGLKLPAAVVGQGPRLAAGCRTEVAEPQDTISAGGVLYRPEAPVHTTCFSPEIDPGSTASDQETPAVYLRFPATDARPVTTVFGADAAFANAHIARESHAAVALRMLEKSPHVVWFVPTPSEDDPPLEGDAPQGPPWFVPALVILGVTGLLLCLSRGRRLGPLVVEPLPVVVPAGETTRARARLYQRTGDREAAARMLTEAAIHDIRTRLRLPAEASTQHIAEAVHRVTGDDADDVFSLLSDPPTHSLGEHAARLRRLRRKVRTS